MRKESYIYKRILKHPTNLLCVLHNCRHCHHNDAIHTPTVVQAYYGTNLGRFVHTCTKCGTTGVLIKWQLKSRWLTLNNYVHKANDPVDVRKTFDSYVETVKTLLGIDDSNQTIGTSDNPQFDYIVDEYEKTPTKQIVYGGRASGKTFRGI